ncbi:MAG: CHASE2 domain-containing protein [Leptolyngbyaceae cyanobacterium SM1_3_5]|nr:CHASE2 domain-containing protein [Leptolyngbyaceae cyanobacterium SM1_3_5]
MLAETTDTIGLPLTPMPQLAEQTIAIGHIRIVQESDGLVRRVEPQVNGQPALWLATMQAYSLVRAEVELPDLHPQWINWPSAADRLPQVSFADVLAGKIPPAQFQDKIVLVGVTATAIDAQATRSIAIRQREA